jgi:hypothetical protein
MKLLTVNVSSTLLTSARRRSSSIKGSFATPWERKETQGQQQQLIKK